MEQYASLFRLSRSDIEALGSDKLFQRAEAVLKGQGACGKIDCKSRICRIDAEWIVIIEELLPYVEKAIGENRHFIREFGDVVRIDQVRKVSAASVEHLSRHSNLLILKDPGKAPRDEDEKRELVPEKLYVREIEDNYQLYENRFLYTLLVYLKDFVQTRYNAIVSEVGASYYELSFKSDIVTGPETYTLTLSMTEKDENIHFTAEDMPGADELTRMNALLELISNLLETSLMKSVAPLSTLPLPITSTNIIKKDPNFQMAYRLWDFIMNYNRKGYVISERHRVVSPISAESTDSLGLVLALLSMTAKAEGLSLYPSLRAKSEKTVLREKSGNAEIDDLRGRLLEEQEKNAFLSHTLESVMLLNETGEVYQACIEDLREQLEKTREQAELRTAENTALHIRLGDYSEEDHLEEDDFLRLSREKEALDSYYKKKLPQAKKKLRQKYIWNKLKEKRKEET